METDPTEMIAELHACATQSIIPVFVSDACGAGDEVAAKRSIYNFKFTGDAFITDTATVCRLLQRSGAS